MPCGVILAGGRSTRFGERDKAVASLAGVPMIRRVADGVVPAVDRIVVSCRDDQTDALAAALEPVDREVALVTDPVPDRGPVAGVATGLRAVDSPYAAVVACDMPFVDPTVLASLFDRAAGHAAVVPRVENGRLQPVQAVYHAARMADACERALEDGEPGLTAVLAGLPDVLEVPFEGGSLAESRSFENVNDRAAFRRAAARLAANVGDRVPDATDR